MATRSFSGGLETQFAGYRLDYPGVLVGISEARGEFSAKFLVDLRRDKYTVHIYRFVEFLGQARLHVQGPPLAETAPCTFVCMGFCCQQEHGRNGA